MMNISSRSKCPLCQLLELFSAGKVFTLLHKYGLQADGLENHPRHDVQLKDMPAFVRDEILQSPPSFIRNILEEFGRKDGSFRKNVTPHYLFDQHWQDLCRSLYLDGYRAKKTLEDYTARYEFIPVEPEIDGMEPIEDDLTAEIKQSMLPNRDEVCRMLQESGRAFCKEEFNACLSKTRIALERIAVGMTNSIQKDSDNRNMRWGTAIAFLRKSKYIDKQEESCLAGVYGLISRGAHAPVGLDEREFVRMGRNLSFACCHFLIKRFNSIH